MKTSDIFRKLYKKFALRSNILLIDHKVLINEFDSITKNREIIRKVIDEYNFKGRNFKVEYLPAILAMAIEEYKKEENKKDNKMNELLKKAHSCF